MTIGPREEQNPYVAELAAIAMALRCLPGWLRNREVIIISSNRSALQVVARPRQQSGQYIVQEIYSYAVMLQSRGNAVKMWVPAGSSNLRGLIEAKMETRKSTESGRMPASQPCLSRATTLRLMMAQIPRQKSIPKGILGVEATTTRLRLVVSSVAQSAASLPAAPTSVLEPTEP